VVAVGPRFVSRFVCLADRCEDTCCQGWRVAVDEEHYRAMERVVDPARLAAAIRPTGQVRPFARIMLGDDGRCPLLEGNLCSVHRDHGADVLGNVCASYPRVRSELGDRLEVAMELSCPEAARLCLLADDAMEECELDPSQGGRGVIRQRVPRDSPLALEPLPPWLKYFADVREVMLGLLGERQFPVASRLFFVAYLAHRLGAIVHPGARTLEPQRFIAEIAAVVRPDALAQLHEKLTAAQPVDVIAATLLTVVIDARLRSSAPPSLRALVTAVAGGDLMALGAQKLDAQHRARASAPPDPAKLERAVENYAKHYLRLEWHLKSPSLLAHVQGLLVRVAALRWLALGHPQASSDFARAVVEAAYAFTRAIDHNEELADDIVRVLVQSKMDTLAHSVSLIKF
jgi:lysine-N-methylase